jgi:hypothetical protein
VEVAHKPHVRLTLRWPRLAAPACASAAPRQPAAGMARQALLSLVALNKLGNAIGALHCCPRGSGDVKFTLFIIRRAYPSSWTGRIPNTIKWQPRPARGRHAGDSFRRCTRAGRPPPPAAAGAPPFSCAHRSAAGPPLSTSSAAVGWRAGSRFPAPVVPVSLRRNERIRALRYGASLSTNRQKTEPDRNKGEGSSGLAAAAAH